VNNDVFKISHKDEFANNYTTAQAGQDTRIIDSSLISHDNITITTTTELIVAIFTLLSP